MKTATIISTEALLVLSFALALLLWPGPVAAQPVNRISKKELKVLLATAKTPSEHRRLATFYLQEAQRSTKRSNYHKEMLALYGNSPVPYEGKFPYGTVGRSHCQKFIQFYAAQAQEAASLAARHEEMAKAAERMQLRP
ncbi:MAG: hypothetical protein ROO76_15350 [Terriglobia bacterium]|jgi:hypothetical protein|nr:hypothetical protein [Terriglobia bacterium]